MLKKISLLLLSLLAFVAVGCTASKSQDQITVVSREASSGTRGAFDEVVGLLVAQGEGKHSSLFAEALISGSNDAVVLAVSKDPSAIGYASPVGIGDRAKILMVDSVEPTAQNISAGMYPIQRPFAFVHTQKSLDNPLVQDFLSFVVSQQGLNVINQSGYVPNAAGNPATYAPNTTLSGKLVLSGSTSVQKVIEKLSEAYRTLTPNVTIETQYSGSVSGIKDVIDAKVDLGLTSRALTAEESTQVGTNPQTIFVRDAVAVIVNPANTISDLTLQQVQQIFTGTVRNWSEFAPKEEGLNN